MIDEKELDTIDAAFKVLTAAARRIYADTGNPEVLETYATGRRWLESLVVESLVDGDPDVDEPYILAECRRIFREVAAHVPGLKLPRLPDEE